MKEKGYALVNSPIIAINKFLKSMAVPDYDEYGCC